MTSSSLSLGQIAIKCRDVARATAFYRDVLQLPLLFEAGGMAFFGLGDVRLMLTLPSAPELDHPGSLLYLRCTDIGAHLAALRGRGATVRRDAQATHRDARHELWMAFFEDSEGNLLALMEERPAAPAG